MSGVVPDEMLPVLRAAQAAQFNTTIALWRAQTGSGGVAQFDRNARPIPGPEVGAEQIPARVVEVLENVITETGAQAVVGAHIRVPCGTAVQIGDKLIPQGWDDHQPPTILSVRSVPDEPNCLFEEILTGRAGT